MVPGMLAMEEYRLKASVVRPCVSLKLMVQEDQPMELTDPNLMPKEALETFRAFSDSREPDLSKIASVEPEI